MLHLYYTNNVNDSMKADIETFIDFLLRPYADKLERQELDYAAFKEEQYDKLAEHMRKHINLPLLYKILTKRDE